MKLCVARVAGAAPEIIEFRYCRLEGQGRREGGSNGDPRWPERARGGAGRRARPDGSSPKKAPPARVPVSAGAPVPFPKARSLPTVSLHSARIPSRERGPSPGRTPDRLSQGIERLNSPSPPVCSRVGSPSLFADTPSGDSPS